MSKRTAPGELEILRVLRGRIGPTVARPGRSQVRIGIGDDCAVIGPRPGEELVITTDFSIEDRHFRLGWHAPEAIGHKCLARGLSDIAAMGARPVAAFVSLAIPPSLTVAPKSGRVAHGGSWLTRFYDGLLALADREGAVLAGGDLAQSPGMAVADIVVLGAVARGRALLRSGARAGDLLYVTGSLGGAAAELAVLEAQPKRFRKVVQADADEKGQALHPHFFPQPRLAVGQVLAGARGRRRLATAAIDISDGLSTDLMHLCEESGVSAEVEAGALPRGRAPALRGATATMEQALHGGDDYELLFTARPDAGVPRRIAGVPIHRIGRMVKSRRGGPALTLVSASGEASALQVAGWQHF